jgi:hypothetical protein
MPPKKSIIPPAPPDLQMRLRGSRAVNPGAPDMPKPKRSSEVVQAERSAKEKEKEAKSAARDAAIARIAELENEMEQADNQTDLVANHPPPTQKKKIVRAPAAIAEGKSDTVARKIRCVLTIPRIRVGCRRFKAEGPRYKREKTCGSVSRCPRR